jgi:hypothetical protein
MDLLKDNILCTKNKNYKDVNFTLENEIRKIGDRQNKKTNLVCNIMTDYKTSETSKVFKNFEKWIMSSVHTMILDFSLLDKNIEPEKYLKLKNWLNRFEIYDMWGAIYQKGDYALLHGHTDDNINMVISFCYMVNVTEKCSPLIFPNSLKPWENSRIISPENGKLIAWSPFLLHCVPPQQVDHERVIIAGNINLNEKKVTYYYY